MSIQGFLPWKKGNRLPEGRSGLALRQAGMAFSVFMLILAASGPAAAVPFGPGRGDEIFPASPHKGMQVTYSLAGVDLEAPVDGKSALTTRTYKGSFSGNALALKVTSSELRGTCRSAAGDSFLLISAAIWVDGQRKDFAGKNPCAGAASGPADQSVNLGRADFTLSLPIPPTAADGGFFIRMKSVEGGSRVEAIVVKGVFVAAGRSAPDLEDLALIQAAPMSNLPGGAADAAGSNPAAASTPGTGPAAGTAPAPPGSGPTTVSPGTSGTGEFRGRRGAGNLLLPLALIGFSNLALLTAIVAIRRRRPPAESSSRVDARLDIFTPDGLKLVYPIDKTSIRVGRSSGYDVSLHDEKISGLHAVIKIEGGKFRIEDLGSTNGILLNGKKIAEGPLHLEDEIVLGSTRLVLKSGRTADMRS
jgi:hypothetical protein